MFKGRLFMSRMHEALARLQKLVDTRNRLSIIKSAGRGA